MPNTSAGSCSFPAATSALLAGLLDPRSPVAGRFFAPLAGVLARLTQRRSCPGLPDEDWLALGVLRVLHAVPSGRAFVQEVGPGLAACPDFNHFFATLRS